MPDRKESDPRIGYPPDRPLQIENPKSKIENCPSSLLRMGKGELLISAQMKLLPMPAPIDSSFRDSSKELGTKSALAAR
jgi:hypothetical protein